MNRPLLTIDVRQEQDVVLCRQRARQIAGLLGFTGPEQTGIATAVSEIARNAVRYAGRGRAEFALGHDEEAGRPTLVVRVADRGPGIPNLGQILDGQYRSATGMGIGITGTRRLSDQFSIESAPGAGTTVTLAKRLPRRVPAATPNLVAEVTAELARRPPANVLEEAREQNRELLAAMEELQARKDEVDRLNAELAETNRGVLALYAELDERAVALERASAYKSRFLSDMTHELRTPLNAMVSLSGLLLDRADGDLTGEQERQVTLIRRSAVSLADMVNDLLDLAKIEAGKVDLRVARFQVADLLSALRGIFRPLLPADGRVRLAVEDPGPGVPPDMCSDEQKASQVLRNFVSNALKFTERGEIRVWVDHDPGRDELRFHVSDTGIGLAAGDRARVFDDFTQVDSALQRRVRGTGLGLPLSRKLARLLGGEVSVASEPGRGSTFTLAVPVECPGTSGPAAEVVPGGDLGTSVPSAGTSGEGRGGGPSPPGDRPPTPLTAGGEPPL